MLFWLYKEKKKKDAAVQNQPFEPFLKKESQPFAKFPKIVKILKRLKAMLVAVHFFFLFSTYNEDRSK